MHGSLASQLLLSLVLNMWYEQEITALERSDRTNFASLLERKLVY